MANENEVQGGHAVPTGTRRSPESLALAAYSTNASFTAIATELADVTEPVQTTSCAVIQVGDYNRIVITPTGTDADTETHKRRIYGVKRVESSAGVRAGYKRHLIATLTCANCPVAVTTSINGGQANALYCDTLTMVSYAHSPDGVISTTNAADVPACIDFDCTGYFAIEIRYAIDGGTGVAMNDFVYKY